MSRSPPTNKIECFAYSEATFFDLVRNAASLSEDDLPAQVRYLARYIEQLGAKALVVEQHYVDRHFIEEVSLYYSTSLTPPPNSCWRIHVLAEKLDMDGLLCFVAEACDGDRAEVTKRLQASYLGYIVLRPLPDSPIGRSVLSPLRDNKERMFPTSLAYPAHLMGLELSSNGLAFQQQDTSVAACATTALWVALQRVCRHEGGRAPTPAAISEAAVRHYLPEGRPFPNSGLTTEQMCEALRRFEFAPDLFRADADTPFLVVSRAYLRSGIPIILGLYSPETDNAEHAVTAVGYRDGAYEEIQVRGKTLRFPTLERIYVHDDRLGPYARAALSVPDQVELETDNGTSNKKEFEDYGPSVALGIESPDAHETYAVKVALAPLYRKLRTSASELWMAGMRLHGLVMDLLETDIVMMEVFFQRSGDYQSSLYEHRCPAARIVWLQQNLAPSRYVGIVRWWIGNEPRVDLVWDTTDRIRHGSERQSLLAVVALHPEAGDAADCLAAQFDRLAG